MLRSVAGNASLKVISYSRDVGYEDVMLTGLDLNDNGRIDSHISDDVLKLDEPYLIFKVSRQGGWKEFLTAQELSDTLYREFGLRSISFSSKETTQIGSLSIEPMVVLNAKIALALLPNQFGTLGYITPVLLDGKVKPLGDWVKGKYGSGSSWKMNLSFGPIDTEEVSGVLNVHK